MSDIPSYEKTIKGEGEEKYRSIFENSIVGFFQSTPEGQFIEANPALAGFLGYLSPEDLISSISDISTQLYANPEDRKRYQKILLQKGRVDGFEFKARCKNGSIKWLSESTIAYFNPDRTPFRYEGVLSDISDRKTAEQKLKDSEKKLRQAHEKFLTVLDSIDVTIYVADMETYTILFMNKYMIESFGRDMTGEICFAALRKETEPCANCTNDQLTDKDGKPAGVCTWQSRNPVTGKFYINRDRAIEWTDGRLVRLQVSTDITEHKQAEEALREQERLQGVMEMAGAICHELNQPLQTVLGFSELLLMDIDSSDPLYKPLNGIETGIVRISELMRRIMGITRYHSKPYLKSQIVDIEKASGKDE